MEWKYNQPNVVLIGKK